MQLAGHWRSPDMLALVRTLSIRRPSLSCCGVPTGTVEFGVFRVQRSRDPGMPIQSLDRNLDRRASKFTTAAVSTAPVQGMAVAYGLMQAKARIMLSA